MLATTSHFHIPSFLILNKADLNQENAVALRNLSQAKDIIFLGRSF
jgi:MinD superfamily P-loop ATPase